MSHTRLIALGTALVIGASVAMPALAASNLAFMQNSPLSFLRAKDNASLAQLADQVLRNKADNETTDWSNKGTGNPVAITGQVTPSNTQKQGDETCRDLVVRLNARGQEVTLRLVACKVKDDAPWKLQKRAAP